MSTELEPLLHKRRVLRRLEQQTRLAAQRCPCVYCSFGYDIARTAVELWDVRLLALVPKPFKKSIKALTRG